ncbi:MAG: DoxX family membrane protein [Chloroflexota bacterium]
MRIFPNSLLRSATLILVAFLFIAAGVTHFTNPDFFLEIVPPYLPAPLLLVYVSGVFEILGGLGVLVPRYRRLAGFGLLLLLVAVFPANIYMALNPEQFPEASLTALYTRLPLQFLFAWLVWFAACSEQSQSFPPKQNTS